MITIEQLEKKIKLLSFTMTAKEMEKLLLYLNGIILWNKAYNLTAITDPNEMLIKHLLDSLVLKPYLLEKFKSGRIIDVGSGAGLPGIPLSIIMPSHHFTLLDSSNKRTRFMRQMKMELELENVEIIHSRVQDFNPNDKYNIVMSRAFATAKDIIKWSEHLLDEDGLFAAMKGCFDEQEWVSVDHYSSREVIVLNVPELNEARHLIFLSK